MMAVYSFPSVTESGVSSSLLRGVVSQFQLVSLTATSPVSAFNQYSAVSGPTTEFWKVSITVPPMTGDNWRQIRALMHQLRGGRNKVRLFDTSAFPMRGVGSASPTINVLAAASVGAEEVSLYGLTASQTGSIMADDQIGIGENLYTVTADANSNGAGETSVQILPALRQGVAAGDPVNIVRPTGLFRLTSGVMTIGTARNSEPLQLEFIEDPDFG